jgi:hypothetical protein
MVGHRTAGTVRETDGKHLQGDLFTGEWQAEPPKRGSGSHIRLKTRWRPTKSDIDPPETPDAACSPRREP